MIRATEQLARLIRARSELNGLEEFRKLKPTELDDLPRCIWMISARFLWPKPRRNQSIKIEALGQMT